MSVLSGNALGLILCGWTAQLTHSGSFLESASSKAGETALSLQQCVHVCVRVRGQLEEDL